MAASGHSGQNYRIFVLNKSRTNISRSRRRVPRERVDSDQKVVRPTGSRIEPARGAESPHGADWCEQANPSVSWGWRGWIAGGGAGWSRRRVTVPAIAPARSAAARSGTAHPSLSGSASRLAGPLRRRRLRTRQRAWPPAALPRTHAGRAAASRIDRRQARSCGTTMPLEADGPCKVSTSGKRVRGAAPASSSREATQAAGRPRRRS